MQTTLLGLAIAFILALVAALVGPHFVDWNQFRPQFEAEATRVIGAPVRVGGQLDARLLPTPSLRLRAVAVGNTAGASTVGADKLDVDFSLSSLMRGEWRATELTLNGLNLDLSLNDRGRLIWPFKGGSFDFGSLAIDRVNLTGRIALHDAASRSTITLDDIAFGGDVRALAGAARGDGNFRYDGVRYPFRFSSGASSDGAGTRLHLNIDPGQRPFGLDLDGVISTQAQVPRFEGTLTLARAIALRGTDSSGNLLQTPWKVSTKVRADPAAAKFEQLEAVYGADDVGLKLSGSADMAFGATPSLRATLAARQLDADRLLAKETATTEPTRLLPGLRGLVSSVPTPPFATRLAVEADSVTLGGRPVQNIAAEFSGDADGWIIDQLQGRAPGATQVALAGRLAPGTDFKGDLKVESTDPDGLVTWLRGRSDPSLRLQGPLRIAGNLSVAPDRIALDGIKATVEGDAIEGRLAVSDGTSDKASDKSLKLDVGVKAARANLDALAVFARAFAGPQAEWPDEVQLSLDIGRGTMGGQEVAPLLAELGYGPAAFNLTSLKLGGTGGVTVDGSGAFDRTASTGKLGLKAHAASLSQITAALAPMLPAGLAARLNALPAAPAGAQGMSKLKFSVALDRMDTTDRAKTDSKAEAKSDSSKSDRPKADRAGGHVANVLATLEVDSPQLKGTTRASAQSTLAALQHFDLDALAKGEINVDSKLAADQGRILLALLGLDRALAAGDGAAQFEATATGIWKAPLRFKAKLAGTNLDADAQGTANPWADDPSVSVTLAARKIDLAPALDLPPGRLPALTISLSSRLDVAGPRLTFSDIDSTVAGSRVRGRLALTRGDEPAFSGELGMDALDLGALFGLAIGATGHAADEPLGRGPLQGARGELAFQALRGVLPGGLELKPVSGTLKGNGASLTLNGVKGSLGGGSATADLTTTNGRDGFAVDARVQLSGVDGQALSYRGLALPAGKTSLQMALSTRGRSAGVLAGALSGSGTLSMENAQISGLDPRAFEVAIAASDAGRVADDRRLRDLIAPVLASAPLPVASVQIPFNIRDGSLRVTSTTLEADGARAVVSGGYDITADQADLRASLVSTRIGTDTSRPEIQIFAHGPPDRLNRTIDVTSLSSWLAVRAIDRETRRLDALERGEPLPPAAPTLPPPTTAAIPPPTAVNPPAAVEPVPDAGALPPPGVPVPGRDQRRREPKAKASPVVTVPPAPALPSPAPPQASNGVPSVAAPALEPLPPPIEVRPAPGMAKPRARAPLVLTPPVQN
ncbi:AsmA family protein [Bradyrhizobium prioriisuperbiae]|uniref:AsmA family protein n=1 Tax=Bradyrhizobium prioriisuperbiae TaxID=2854389 RepID=UPI0028EEF977|nr:AsmA family protein [Bradyrhizobium prioritasuperba]